MPKWVKWFIKWHKPSINTKIKIWLSNRWEWVEFNCQECNKSCEEKLSHYKKKKRHFCSMKCYSDFRKTKLPLEEQHAYKWVRKDWDSKQVYHRNYVYKHRAKVNHLKLRHYARKKWAEGSHTLEERELLKKQYEYKCRGCLIQKRLTKDHIIPLSKWWSNYISNIQPLCHNCNSKKHNKLNYIYENPELLA
jgi:5-methylcytosine-specific restriction enzyme A